MITGHLADGYHPLCLAATLMPGEWRDLPNGGVRFCCRHCGELVDGESTEFVPDHFCRRTSPDEDGAERR